MDNNQSYMRNLKIEEVPWHRLTTAYGRATDFPKYFRILWDMSDLSAAKAAFYEIESSIEHQDTLWHATPLAVVFLLRIFEHAVNEMDKNSCVNYIIENCLDVFEIIAECFHMGNNMEHADPLPNFSDLLNEEYLWSEEYDEEEDISRYEEEQVFPDDLFYSIWYYSYQALMPCTEILKRLKNTPFYSKAEKLSDLLSK